MFFFSFEFFKASADLLWDENCSLSANENLIAIRHCTAVMNLLIENILANGSQDSSKPVVLKDVLFDKFVQDVLNFSNALLVTSKNVTVKMKVEKCLQKRVVYMSEMECKQALFNLVSNAIKFSYKDRPQCVNVEFRSDGEGFVLAEVCDQGEGVRKVEKNNERREKREERREKREERREKREERDGRDGRDGRER